MRIRWAIGLALTVGFGGGGIDPSNAAWAEVAGLASGRASITSEELASHVFLLADDAFEGREAGSRGGYAAANYLLQQMQPLLKPAGTDGGYYQPFAPRYRNLLGILPGTDPLLQHEYVLIGAHYDHVGYGTPGNSRGTIGLIHNGADDNASGTAALLEVLQAFAHSGVRTRRSLVFAFWDGEEKGLLGSEHWNNWPTVPRDQVRLAINIDMIGHLGEQPLEIIGSRSLPGLRWLLAQANHRNELKLTFPWVVKENSDHYSFFSRNIPVLMFHTGLHDDYHKPTDDAETLDIDGLRTATRFIFNALVMIANQEAMGQFRVASRHENETMRADFERPLPPPPPRLGIRWRQPNEVGTAVDGPHEAGAHETGPPETGAARVGEQPASGHDSRAGRGGDAAVGLLLDHVATGSAADRAGLRPGDRLVALGGTPLRSSSTLQQAAVEQQALLLDVLRYDDPEQQPETVSVWLPGSAARVGISWRDNPAEPNTVTVVRVVRHSRADRAGIKTGDRIHQLNGAEFTGPVDFQQQISAIALPATLLVERDGQILELLLDAR